MNKSTLSRLEICLQDLERDTPALEHTSYSMYIHMLNMLRMVYAFASVFLVDGDK